MIHSQYFIVVSQPKFEVDQLGISIELPAEQRSGFISITISVPALLLVSIFPEDHNEINCLDFSMDGDFYGTGGKDKHVRVYDVNTNKVQRTMFTFCFSYQPIAYNDA